MSTPPKPGTVAYQRTTQYAVSCLPEDDDEGFSWLITVEYRGRQLWAVKNRGRCLSRAGQWVGEIRDHDDAWEAEHRYALDEALELARDWAPRITVMGRTVADLLAWRAEQDTEAGLAAGDRVIVRFHPEIPVELFAVRGWVKHVPGDGSEPFVRLDSLDFEVRIPAAALEKIDDGASETPCDQREYPNPTQPGGNQ
jgi:hypothetical protein